MYLYIFNICTMHTFIWKEWILNFQSDAWLGFRFRFSFPSFDWHWLNQKERRKKIKSPYIVPYHWAIQTYTSSIKMWFFCSIAFALPIKWIARHNKDILVHIVQNIIVIIEMKRIHCRCIRVCVYAAVCLFPFCLGSMQLLLRLPLLHYYIISIQC